MKLIKVLCSVILILCMITPTAFTQAEAAEATKYPLSPLQAVAMTSGTVDVYKDGDTKIILGQLPVNSPLIISGKSNGYYQIQFNNGIGYVNPKYTTRYYEVKDYNDLGRTTTTVPVYAIADTSKIVDNLAKGTKLVITGKSNGYYQIVYKQTVAFINPKYVTNYYESEPISFNSSTIAKAPIYQFADTSKPMGELPIGTNVKVVALSNGYYEIEFKDDTVFIASKYVGKQYEQKSMSLTGIVTNAAAFYGFADTAYQIGTVPAKTRVHVVAQSNGYYRLSYNGIMGYIHPKNFLQDAPLEAFKHAAVMTKAAPVYQYSDTSTKVDTISEGTNVAIQGKANGYYYIIYNDKKGFVAPNAVHLVYDVTPLSLNGIVSVAADVYKYADTSSKLTTYKVNTTLKITGKANGYYQIRYNNEVAYIDMKKVGIQYPVIVMNNDGITTKSTPLYQFADTSKTVKTIAASTKVKVTGLSNGYYAVTIGSVKGFINSNHIGLTYALTSLSQNGVTIHAVDVYQFANTSHKLGTLLANSKVKVTGKSNGYYRIAYNNSTAFVEASEVGFTYDVKTMSQTGVTTSQVTMYQFADTSHKAGTLKAGTTVVITGKSNGYYRIKNGATAAYINAKYVGINYEITDFVHDGVTKAAVTTYQFADTSHKAGSFVLNKKVQIVGIANGYYRIKNGSSFVYVDKSKIRLTYVDVKYPNRYEGTVIASAKVYKYADTSQTVKTLKKGDVVKVTHYSNGYVKVTQNDKVVGYMDPKYIAFISPKRKGETYLLQENMRDMSSEAYNKKKNNVGNWTYVKTVTSIESAKSMEMKIFRKLVSGASSQKKYDYTFAYKGTKEFTDFKADAIEVVLGVEGKQTKSASEQAIAYLSSVSGTARNVYFTGHSLGGYLAAWVASDLIDGAVPTVKASQVKAYTFNAPGISIGANTTKYSNAVDGKYDSKITYYYIISDVVSNFGRRLGKPVGYLYPITDLKSALYTGKPLEHHKLKVFDRITQY